MIGTAAAEDRSLLVELLLQRGVITPEALREARPRGQEASDRALIDAGLVGEMDVARAYAEYLAVPLFDPGPARPGAGPAADREALP